MKQKYAEKIIFVILIVVLYISLVKWSYDVTEGKSYEEYQVISVYQYTSIETGIFGKVKDQDICYYFTYIDDDGVLHEYEKFELVETPSGYNKLCIGEENKYVKIESELGINEYLYLTEEKLNNIQSK